jgi:hypothetical protein
LRPVRETETFNINPYAFTEQGIAMLSVVLKSDVAVEVSVKIMNSFIEMKKFFTFKSRTVFKTG